MILERSPYLIFFIAWVGRTLLLLVGYKSTNPMSRALSLILALVLISPLVSTLSFRWFIYLMLLLFLSGVLVLVVYFTRLRSLTMKYVKVRVVYRVVLLFFPTLEEFICSNNVRLLYLPDNLGVVFYLVFRLVGLILFSSYMLSYGTAMRRM